MENLVPLFIIVTAIAVVIQAGILVALFIAVRQTSGRVEALASEVKTKAVPTIETAQAMLVELRPRVTEIVANVEYSSRIARAQIERVDATVSDAVDRTRLQVIRADELINRTLDRVEETRNGAPHSGVADSAATGIRPGTQRRSRVLPRAQTAAGTRRHGRSAGRAVYLRATPRAYRHTGTGHPPSPATAPGRAGPHPGGSVS